MSFPHAIFHAFLLMLSIILMEFFKVHSFNLIKNSVSFCFQIISVDLVPPGNVICLLGNDLLIKRSFSKNPEVFLSQFLALFFTLKYQSQKEHLFVHMEVGTMILFFICSQTVVLHFTEHKDLMSHLFLYFLFYLLKANLLPPCFAEIT